MTETFITFIKIFKVNFFFFILLDIILYYFLIYKLIKRHKGKKFTFHNSLSIFLGILIFFFVLYVYYKVAFICVDGYSSNSIGTQGACSHHGGVKDRPLDNYFFPIAHFIGYVVTIFYSERCVSFTKKILHKI